MPKSTKKKKDKAADFSKAKLKLGKGKQVATNAVDTSFKSRSIALPGQSIINEKSAETPVTKRKHTFDDLIAHLKHYNAATRKDAIYGLRELFEAYPQTALVNLATVLNRCVRIIGDEDASVRKALLSFFGWFIPFVPRPDLQPHSPVLLLFTTSALTHIFPEIRIDAIRFLDIFLEYIPEIVVGGWASDTSSHGRRVLEGYLGLLNAGTAFGDESGPVRATSTASVVLSPKSKLVVITSLSTFLREAMRARSGGLSHTLSAQATSLGTPTWFFAPSFASRSAFGAFDSLIRPGVTNVSQSLRQFSEDMDPWHDGGFYGSFECVRPQFAKGWTLDDLSDHTAYQWKTTNSKASSSSGYDVEDLYISHLARTLQPALLSTFLDCAPVTFSPGSSPPETELQMSLIICEIVRSLYGTLLQDYSKPTDGKVKATEDLSTILGHMAPYFPFFAPGLGSVKRDIKVERAFEGLNLVFCELTSLLVLASPSSPYTPQNYNAHSEQFSTKRATTAGLSLPAALSLQVDRVKLYTIRLLRGEPLSGPNTQTTLSHSIPHSSYSALLPTIWALINTPRTSSELLIALINHALKASSGSAGKRYAIDFLSVLMLLETEPQYHGVFRTGRFPEEDKHFREWLLHLPKTLWELGPNNLSTSETVLRLFLRLSQRQASFMDISTSAAIRARLVPYFTITHATRGRLPGPFTKLPPLSFTRKLALDVAATMPGPNKETDDLSEAVRGMVCGTDEGIYWRSITTRNV